MRGRSAVNFRATTLFACSAKVVSSARDACCGIPAAGRAVAHARQTHTVQWLLALFYFSTQ